MCITVYKGDYNCVIKYISGQWRKFTLRWAIITVKETKLRQINLPGHI